LLFGPDALCHTAHVELASETRYGLDDGGAICAFRQVTDETAINLDGVERKAAQVAERGEGGAKIIERDADALVAQSVEDR
jgi:predicted mannosyl-3-phosphoglycerate phosphatase (HAD superfamily)